MNRDELIPWSALFSGLNPASYTPDIQADISMSNMIDDFSILLYHYRCDHNLTQRQLADQLDVSQAMVSSYEAGSRNPSLKTIAETAAKLGYSVSISFTPQKDQLANKPIMEKLDDINNESLAIAA